MSYQSITIREAVEGVNEKYFLPDIQREYVWKPEQAILLMDSVFSTSLHVLTWEALV